MATIRRFGKIPPLKDANVLFTYVFYCVLCGMKFKCTHKGRSRCLDCKPKILKGKEIKKRVKR